MSGLAPLALAALAWVGLHIGLAGTGLRGILAGRLGEKGFRGLFSLLSVAAIWFLVARYRDAPSVPLWFLPDGLRWLLALAMLPAFMLFVAAVAAPNPTSVEQERALAQEVRGIQRVTRHPMLWSFALWAAVHLLAKGDAAGLLFFGAFLVTALAGMPSIDAKLARRDPERWRPLAAATSILPFAAIAAGRNRFVPGEIGWLPPLLGLAAWAALLAAHPYLFGVPAVSPG